MKALLSTLVLFSCLASTYICHSTNIARNKTKRVELFDRSKCDQVEGFTQELRDEIRSKKPQVEVIKNAVLHGIERHSTYNELAYFVDKFGPRMSGSDSLADAIVYLKNKLTLNRKLEVHGEKALIPKWTIGQQWAEIVRPVRHPMSILALGYSVGTNNQTIEAEAIVVKSFEDLDEKAKLGRITGKIVVFNYKFTTYGESVKFRSQGAKKAAKYGAVAALVRSVTPFSIYSPHAGAGSKSVPTAAITVEDAELIQRWVKRGESVVLKLFMDAQNHDDVESMNIIGDFKGSSKPDEVILISGHMDSWYNTQGAMDDGGGMMISLRAVDLLGKLNLRAKRTVRAVLWVAEEFGLIGAQQYFKDHKHELGNFKVVMESDLGTFNPLGLSFTNLKPFGQCVLGDILDLLKDIGTNHLDNNYEGSDIELFSDEGVPALSLLNENSRYFFYHHTSGDSMSVENPDELDRSTILWAVTSHVLADLSVDIH